MALIDLALGTAAPRSRARAWLPIAVGVAIIAALLLRFGPEPFLDAFRRLDAWAVVAAVVVGAASTASAAYRWHVVAAGLAVPVGMARAVRAYYASQFLNATLPGGVLGDLHRGLRQGRQGQPLGRSLRAVAWERVLGQLAQVLVTVAVLAVVPSPLRPSAPVWAGLAGVTVLSGALLLVVRARAGRRRVRTRAAPRQMGTRSGRPPVGNRVARALAADWRGIRGKPHALPRIAVASVLAVCGHVTVFLLAARSVLPHLAIGALVPMALLVLLVGALPVNVAGWGPREGAAAWAFGAAGMGAAQGLSISVLYGVLALLGTLPGALLLTRRQPDGGHG